MINTKFNIEKAIEATYFFIELNGGKYDKYLLIKLLYIAERLSWLWWERPLTGDKLYSMEYGPVLSEIYDLTCNNKEEEYRSYWSEYLITEGNTVKTIKRKEFEELNLKEEGLLKKVYEEFKDFDFNMMKNYCHDNLKEWTDTKGTSIYISVDKLLEKLGNKKPTEIEEIREDIEDYEYLKKLLNC